MRQRRFIYSKVSAVIVLFALLGAACTAPAKQLPDVSLEAVQAEASGDVVAESQENGTCGHNASAVGADESQPDEEMSDDSKALAPTGYPSGEIQAKLIFVNGQLYVYDSWATAERITFNDMLLRGYEAAGEIISVNNTVEPSEELTAVHVEPGTTVYVHSADPVYIYIQSPYDSTATSRYISVEEAERRNIGCTWWRESEDSP